MKIGIVGATKQGVALGAENIQAVCGSAKSFRRFWKRAAGSRGRR